MEENLDKILRVFNEEVKEDALSTVSPVVLAWIGDGVYSYYIRKYLVHDRTAKINQLNSRSVDYVEAAAQSHIVHYLIENELNDEEKEIVRRGRNTRSHAPKNADILDYRYATGFEALLGWLALRGDFKRIEYLCALAITLVDQKNRL